MGDVVDLKTKQARREVSFKIGVNVATVFQDDAVELIKVETNVGKEKKSHYHLCNKPDAKK